MQKDSKLFDDFARMASGAAGGFLDMKREWEAVLHDKAEKILSRMNLVRREEFETVRLLAEEARLKQEEMSKRLAEFEKKLDSLERPNLRPEKPLHY